LKDCFSRIGKVVRADVEEEPTGKSKGWGIVEYANSRDATKAINQLNNCEFKGRPLNVRADGKNKGSSASGCKIYVGNLSWEVRWQDLKDHFKNVGFVVKADVMEEPGSGR
jgi:RNA recognition motif-containing protein